MRKGWRRSFPPTPSFCCLGGLTPGPHPTSGPLTSSSLEPPATQPCKPARLRPHRPPGDMSLQALCSVLAPQPTPAPSLSQVSKRVLCVHFCCPQKSCLQWVYCQLSQFPPSHLSGNMARGHRVPAIRTAPAPRSPWVRAQAVGGSGTRMYLQSLLGMCASPAGLCWGRRQVPNKSKA